MLFQVKRQPSDLIAMNEMTSMRFTWDPPEDYSTHAA